MLIYLAFVLVLLNIVSGFVIANEQRVSKLFYRTVVSSTFILNILTYWIVS